MRPRDRLSGFTLIELIIVLVILSVMTALVAPRLTKSLGRMNAESAARRIASSLRFARSLAITEKVPYLAKFDMGADTLTLVSYQQTSEKRNPPEFEADHALASRVYGLTEGIHLEEGVSLNGETIATGAFQMVFFPGGGSSGGEVVIGDDEGRSYVIALDRITGSAKINEKGATDD